MITKYFYLLLALLLWNCQVDPASLQAPATTQTLIDGIPFKKEFSIQAGEQVVLAGGEAPRKLHLALKQLNDSRCPDQVTCVQYGAASVLLSVANSQGKNDSLELCIGGCTGQTPRSTHTVTVLIGQTSYSITLKEIKPYPGLEKFEDVKQAVLVVEKL
ncbi:hypothetical protein FVR03_21055 [Pontibacter qinzhouensis]|uniref:Lipoprotein n=1 Tax=Pontibacter qinzhouensis TaxID=2603253 RepID=A0A5C8J0X0_9BACT|nr:hypothetical protein [Pontibacter qinzhouensis]TXK27720.1 hypothetical protein FVR03_21055 [Pontibacter qinzhouensis]